MWRPRFRSDYVPVRLPDGPLVVLGEGRSVLIDDPVAADLAEQLDGTAPLGRSAGPAGHPHPVTAARRARSRRLRGRGLLTSGRGATSAAEAAGWDARGVPPDADGGGWPAGTVAWWTRRAQGGRAADALRAARAGPDGGRRRTHRTGGADTAAGAGAPASMLDPRLAGSTSATWPPGERGR